MSIPTAVLAQVRERAGDACEYCGVREIDVGGELTVDHIHPQAAGGSDDADNLAYACARCNEYKGAYRPTASNPMPLWNPRTQARTDHLLPLQDGRLFGLTPTGEQTISRLRLNRPALVEHRLARQVQRDREQELEEYRDMAVLLGGLLERQERLQQEQADLLAEYRRLLRLLIGETSDREEPPDRSRDSGE